MSSLTDYFQALLLGNNQMPRRPGDTDIRHFTLNSCHGCNIPGGKVPPAVVKQYRQLLTNDLGSLSVEEEEKLTRAGGRYPLPGSYGQLDLLATSDPECGGNELSFTIYLRNCQHRSVPLVYGRCYDALDGMAPRKWDQLVGTFIQNMDQEMATTWMGFDHELLIDPPQGPWLGVILTKQFDALEALNGEIGIFLSSAEQAIAVTWRVIRDEAKREGK